MNLDRQIQVLIEDAPQDGVTPKIIEAIAPVLKTLASQLKHTDYYILQNRDQDWVLTTISNRANPQLEKNVVYAFPSLKEANAFGQISDPEVVALPVPVTHILFQMFAIDIMDSTVFFDTPGMATGTEVRREDLQNLIQIQLQKIQPQTKANFKNIPPDIA